MPYPATLREYDAALTTLIHDVSRRSGGSVDFVRQCYFGTAEIPMVVHYSIVDSVGFLHWRWACSCGEKGLPTWHLREAERGRLAHDDAARRAYFIGDTP